MNKPSLATPGYRIVTLGCRVNQYESESIEADLQKTGWQPTKPGVPANLCIVNTCTVTAKAAMQSRQALRHAIRQNPDAVMVVTGCYVQSEPKVFSEIPGVHLIVGNTEKHRIPKIISTFSFLYESPPRLHWQQIHSMKRLPETALPVTDCRARPYLKIQDGCEDFCSYCIVPYTRGPSRSLPPETVLTLMEKLRDQGAKETVLTGIHLGRYGLDLSPGTSLYALLKQIVISPHTCRVRLSSIEPCEISPEIIELVKQRPVICPHFHIPLQSGDEQILKKMKRPYSPALFDELVRAIHENLPHAAIGVDVLVGFPGEDEDAFEHTYTLLASLPIAYLHVFPFSPRPPTPASRFSGQVAAPVIKNRCARLRDLSRAKRHHFYQTQLGRTVDVIIEDRRDPETGRLKAISSNYLTVLTDAPDHYRNMQVNCRLTGPVVSDGILGRIAGGA